MKQKLRIGAAAVGTGTGNAVQETADRLMVGKFSVGETASDFLLGALTGATGGWIDTKRLDEDVAALAQKTISFVDQSIEAGGRILNAVPEKKPAPKKAN